MKRKKIKKVERQMKKAAKKLAEDMLADDHQDALTVPFSFSGFFTMQDEYVPKEIFITKQRGYFFNAAEPPAPMVFSKPLSTGWPEDVKSYNLRWPWLAKLAARIGNFISWRLK